MKYFLKEEQVNEDQEKKSLLPTVRNKLMEPKNMLVRMNEDKGEKFPFQIKDVWNQIKTKIETIDETNTTVDNPWKDLQETQFHNFIKLMNHWPPLEIIEGKKKEVQTPTEFHIFPCTFQEFAFAFIECFPALQASYEILSPLEWLLYLPYFFQKKHKLQEEEMKTKKPTLEMRKDLTTTIEQTLWQELLVPSMYPNAETAAMQCQFWHYTLFMWSMCRGTYTCWREMNEDTKFFTQEVIQSVNLTYKIHTNPELFVQTDGDWVARMRKADSELYAVSNDEQMRLSCERFLENSTADNLVELMWYIEFVFCTIYKFKPYSLSKTKNPSQILKDQKPLLTAPEQGGERIRDQQEYMNSYFEETLKDGKLRRQYENSGDILLHKYKMLIMNQKEEWKMWVAKIRQSMVGNKTKQDQKNY